jgi:hypothetical protein
VLTGGYRDSGQEVKRLGLHPPHISKCIDEIRHENWFPLGGWHNPMPALYRRGSPTATILRSRSILPCGLLVFGCFGTIRSSASGCVIASRGRRYSLPFVVKDGSPRDRSTLLVPGLSKNLSMISVLLLPLPVDSSLLLPRAVLISLEAILPVGWWLRSRSPYKPQRGCPLSLARIWGPGKALDSPE